MRNRVITLIGIVASVFVVAGLLRMTGMSVDNRTSGSSLKTPWGEPDLQGIWTDPYETPLQRPAKFAGKEFFSDQERADLDQQRASIPRRNARAQLGSERDVAGAYNAVYQSIKPTGKRTSLIVDPPDGRLPPLTPEAAGRRKTEMEYRLALLQATVTCKNHDAACAGGKYGPPSPRRAEMPGFYNTGRTNRNDNPEDRAMSERCMAAVLPDFGGFRRIVQSPGTVAILYDTGQGQGWERIIPITTNPHIPSSIRERFGDSRGRWDGNTLVVDVTNFSPKFSFMDARENLHLVERFTRVDANTIEYAVTIEDPTAWTKPWTVKQELVHQDEQANRIYHEPRCHEGNFGLPTMLRGARTEEEAFAKGRGPDPATKDTATDFGNEGGTDALTN